MDTTVKTPLTDSLGRRTGPRRKYSIAEKREVVEESLQPGASVAIVAQRRGINANQVFFWRRLHKQGLLSEAPSAPPPLLPVTVTTPTLAPTQRAADGFAFMAGWTARPSAASSMCSRVDDCAAGGCPGVVGRWCH